MNDSSLLCYNTVVIFEIDNFAQAIHEKSKFNIQLNEEIHHVTKIHGYLL